MKKEQISEALSFIDDNLIEQTNKLRMAPRKKRPAYIGWVRYGSLVAAAALIFVVGIRVIGSVHGGTKAATPLNQQKECESTSLPNSFFSENVANDNIDSYTNDYAEKTFMIVATCAPQANDSLGQSENDFDLSGSKINSNEKEGMIVPESDDAAVKDVADDFTGVKNDASLEDVSTENVSTKGGSVGIGGPVKRGSKLTDESQNIITTSDVLSYDVLSANAESLSVLFTNSSSQNVEMESYYELEELLGDSWYTCKFAVDEQMVGWNAILYKYNAKESARIDYTFEYLYGPLEKGRYRVVQNMNFENMDEKITLAFEFMIE